MVLLALISIAAMLKVTDWFSRIWFGLWTIISTAGLVTTLLVSQLAAIRKRDRNRQRHGVVLVGAGEMVQLCGRYLRDHDIARLLILNRSREKAEMSAARVGATITPVACELSELDSVAACSEEIDRLDCPIDALICNAGVMGLPELRQKNGLEMQFLTNHLGHYVLVRQLLERVLQSPAGRIVIVSSLGHYFAAPGGINFDNLSGERNYDPWTFYGQSKLANLLMSNELARRLDGSVPENGGSGWNPGAVSGFLAPTQS